MVIQEMKEKWHDKIFYNNPKYLGIQCLRPLGSKSYSSIYNLNFQTRYLFTTFTVSKRFKKSFLIPWYLLNTYYKYQMRHHKILNFQLKESKHHQSISLSKFYMFYFLTLVCSFFIG